MKKTILLCAGGFVLALVLGTGVSSLLLPGSEIQDGLHEESGGVHAFEDETPASTGPSSIPIAADSPVSVSAHPAGHPMELDPRPVAGEGEGASAIEAGHDDPLRTPAAPADAETSESPVDYRAFSRILMAMKAEEASRIMAHLSDDQLEGVLRSLGTRHTAEILSLLPTDRAVRMSLRLLSAPDGAVGR